MNIYMECKDDLEGGQSAKNIILHDIYLEIRRDGTLPVVKSPAGKGLPKFFTYVGTYISGFSKGIHR